MTYTPVRVKKLTRDAMIPQHAHADDAGVDLNSVEDVVLAPGQRMLVGAGVATALSAGTVGLVRPRSGSAFKGGLSIVNAPSTIDAGYCGELKVCLINLDPTSAVEIAKGDRIAQLVVQKVELNPMVEVDELDEIERGADDRGSARVSTTL